MSLIRRIEALEATSSVHTTSNGPDEIWLVSVSPDGSRECGGGWVKDKGRFRSVTADEAHRHNLKILLGNHHE